MKTAIMFAHECAPYHRPASTIGAQRPANFAKFLGSFGWRLIVICCDFRKIRSINKNEISAVVSEIDKQLLSFSENESVVIATPSLKCDGYIDKLWYSLVSKKEDGSYLAKNSRLSYLRKPSTLLKLFTGDYSQSWQPVALAVAERIIAKVNIDICIAEHSPDAGIFIANKISEKYKIPWIVDFRDPVLMPFTGIGHVLFQSVVKGLVKNASATINANPPWTELDNQLFHIPAYTITNGFDEQEFVSQQSNHVNNEFLISYFGSIKQFQDIDVFFDSYKGFVDSLDPKDRCMVKFIYRGLQSDFIIKTAKNHSVDAYVDSQNFIPRKDSIQIMLKSNVLLLLGVSEWGRQNKYYKAGFYPGKVFEYLACKKPILCVPSDEGIMSKLIEATNAGVSLSNKNEITDFLLLQFQFWKKKTTDHFTPNLTEISNYSRKSQTEKLSQILNRYCRKD